MVSTNELIFYAKPKWLGENKNRRLGCPGLSIYNKHSKLKNSNILNSTLKVSSQALNEIYRTCPYNINYSHVNYMKSMDNITKRIGRELSGIDDRIEAIDSIEKYWTHHADAMNDWRPSNSGWTARKNEWENHKIRYIVKELSWYPYGLKVFASGVIHTLITIAKLGIHVGLYAFPIQFIKGIGPALSANHHLSKNHELVFHQKKELHPIYFRNEITDTLKNIPFLRYLHKGSDFESMTPINSLPTNIEEFAVINYHLSGLGARYILKSQHHTQTKKMYEDDNSLDFMYNISHRNIFKLEGNNLYKNFGPLFQMKYYRKIGDNWEVYQLRRRKRTGKGTKYNHIQYDLKHTHTITNILRINQFGYIRDNSDFEFIDSELSKTYSFIPFFETSMKFRYDNESDMYINECMYKDYNEIEDIYFSDKISRGGHYPWGHMNSNTFNTLIWEDKVYPVNYPRSLPIPTYK